MSCTCCATFHKQEINREDEAECEENHHVTRWSLPAYTSEEEPTEYRLVRKYSTFLQILLFYAAISAGVNTRYMKALKIVQCSGQISYKLWIISVKWSSVPSRTTPRVVRKFNPVRSLFFTKMKYDTPATDSSGPPVACEIFLIRGQNIIAKSNIYSFFKVLNQQ